jgi:hypothetical protein
MTESSEQPISTLRGAGVDFNSRKVARVVIGLCLATMAVLVVVFTVAGAQKNSQINSLRQHGVKVDVAVTKCQGLMGGSGSNAAGYACQGTFTLGGHRYTENIPGNSLYPPGHVIRSVSVPDDPALVSPISMVNVEHASWRVFILPAVLLIVLGLVSAGLVLRRRHRTEASSPSP